MAAKHLLDNFIFYKNKFMNSFFSVSYISYERSRHAPSKRETYEQLKRFQDKLISVEIFHELDQYSNHIKMFFEHNILDTVGLQTKFCTEQSWHRR